MTYEVIRNYEIWDYSFCGENTISTIHFPKSVTVKRSKTISLPGSKGLQVDPDVYLVQNDCSKDRTAEEVERQLNENGTN